MVRRIEPVCANCKHLHYTYTNTGMGIYHRCEVREEPEYIGASQTWQHSCGKWEVKQNGYL